MNNIMHTDVESILVSEEQINEITTKLGAQIAEDHKDSKKLVLLCILKGSVVFYSDLMRKINIPCALEFMRVSSYKGAETTHQVTMLLDVERKNIENADVIIVEDIIDTGRTLSYLMKLLQERNPGSLKLCSLLDKPDRRISDVNADYIGFVIPDLFVVGYGLDYAQKYRNLPYIGVVETEE